MNRHDEIQAKARDIATNVHQDPDKRNALADDLISLVALMMAAQGKYLASYGEGELNDHIDDPRESAKYHTMYLAGERMQESARLIEGECSNPDPSDPIARRGGLDRWDPPVWKHKDRRPEDVVHADTVDWDNVHRILAGNKPEPEPEPNRDLLPSEEEYERAVQYWFDAASERMTTIHSARAALRSLKAERKISREAYDVLTEVLRNVT